MRIAIQRLAHAEGLALPSYATAGSAGLDLLAAIDAEMTINPGERKAVPTGIALAVPEGFEAQVRPRSGLALRHGITVLNAPGTVDSDYRGEVMAILINHGNAPFAIARGMKIAQLVVAQHARVEWLETADLTITARGAAGFGSTGLGT
ncbi:MAG: dUTP diphosphatase [Alphaproteobacteria bacterium]|nr:dUTP diphosphatase [Alphaproteobacteria bacterium]